VQQLFPTADELTVVERAGHFLQEDRGELVASLIIEWANSLEH
jgi:pimeloyl-ACP methyl ester carboxylesterase